MTKIKKKVGTTKSLELFKIDNNQDCKSGKQSKKEMSKNKLNQQELKYKLKVNLNFLANNNKKII